ncbi:MAG: SMC-Scp complex subunit ScpB [Terracidiphilus sp.]
MSLKAKLEAVIYAAEEPVTLAQLAFLFSHEALEWKAEQEAAAAAPAAEPQQLLDDAFSYLELGPSAEALAAPEPENAAAREPIPAAPAESTSAPAAESEAPSNADAQAGAESANEADSAPEPSQPETGPATGAEAGSEPEAAPDPEAESRRQARQRDREIRAVLRRLLDELIASYAAEGRGIEIREIAGGYRMATKPEFHDAVRGFVKSLKPPLKLSLPALETLAVVAYKQPVTAPEVNEIRGVDSSGVFGSLLGRKLISTAGRKQVVGRPILYKTTREFLLRFGLKDVSELPSMEEFEKMAAMELDEPEEANGELSASESAADAGPELDETASEERAGETAGEPAASTQPSNQAEPLSAEAATAQDSITGQDSVPAAAQAAEQAAGEAAEQAAEQAETEQLTHD